MLGNVDMYNTFLANYPSLGKVFTKLICERQNFFEYEKINKQIAIIVIKS